MSDFADSGYAVGDSERFDGSATLGQSAWLYDSARRATVRLGFFDAVHTRGDGHQNSSASFVNEAGDAVGISRRYDAFLDLGRSAWVHDGATSTLVRVGFVDAGHTRADGFQLSEIGFLTDSGLVAGYSDRFGASPLFPSGETAWIYDLGRGATTRVGLFDAEHVRSDGYQASRVGLLEESGHASGYSFRYAGSTSMGSSAWVYDGASGATTKVGLVDAVHTRSDGYRYSEVRYLAETGYAAGVSSRFDSGPAVGSSTWFYDPGAGASTRVGLFDAQHTRSDGLQLSDLTRLTNSGIAAGTSDRFAGGTSLGQSAWLFDASSMTTTRVGLFDAAHTLSDGSQSSTLRLLTESGFAAGESQAPSGGSQPGRSAWVYDPADGTTRVGLFDAVHTGSDGYRYSRVDFLTTSGFAAGYSQRWGAPGFVPGIPGETAWIYDAVNDRQETIMLSERSDGYALSRVDFLTEAGVAVGNYQLFDDQDRNLGNHAFVWTPADGALDLGGLVDGGLAAAGWTQLYAAVGADGLDRILGEGLFGVSSFLPYLLVPLPEPGTLLLLIAGLAVARRRARRA